MSLANCLLGLLAFSSLVLHSHQQASSLPTCYKCKGNNEDDCVNSQTASQCSSVEHRCASGYFTKLDNSVQFIKGCVNKSNCNGVNEICRDTRRGKVCLTCCEGDLCNSGKIKPELKCYTCMSTNKKACVNNPKEKICPAGTQCASTYMNDDGAEFYTKDCASQEECDAVKENQCESYEDYHYCMRCCKGQLCNAGEIHVPTIIKRRAGALSDLLGFKTRGLFDMFDNQHELDEHEE